MKRIAILILSGLIVAGSLSAQAAAPNAAPSASQTLTITKVEGKLALINGMIAIHTKDKTYYVGGLLRLVGFIDGLKCCFSTGICALASDQVDFQRQGL